MFWTQYLGSVMDSTFTHYLVLSGNQRFPSLTKLFKDSSCTAVTAQQLTHQLGTKRCIKEEAIKNSRGRSCERPAAFSKSIDSLGKLRH